MAKIKLGPNITDISGSVKEVIYVPWKRSQYAVKSRAGIYQNPQSPRQTLLRSVTQESGFIFKNTLTPAQRNNWNEFAQGLASQDGKFGGIRNLIPKNRGIMSGYHAFVMCRSRALMSGITLPANFNDSPLGQTPPSCLTGLAASWKALITVNYSLLFDGVDEYVNVQDVLGYEYNQPQSWEFWVKPLGPQAGDWFISKTDIPQDHGYYYGIVAPNLRLQMTRAAGVEGLVVIRSFPFSGVWKHAVLTYDGSNSSNGMRIYVDTVVGQTIVQNVPLTGTIKTSDPLVFASLTGAPAALFKGHLDCIRNYNRVLTQPNVNALFNAGAGLYGADPFSDGSCQGAWMFCTGSGITLFDISGNNYHGTLVNMEPGDWVPGKVPCPISANWIDLTWTDPVIVTANSKIRVWIRSRELGVHKQLIHSVDLSEESKVIQQVRMSQGALHDVTDFPGHYLIQADVVQPNGLLSPPSNTVEVTVP